MNEKTCAVSESGRITLPKALRDRYGIRPGDDLQMIVSEGVLCFLLPPVNKRPKAYAEIHTLALTVFDGNEEAAARWLHRPQVGLGNARPVDRMKTTEGAKDVEILLGRMEYGVLA